MSKNQTFSGVLILIGVAIVANTLFAASRSSDLLATWIAGQMYITGQFSEIYVTGEPLFTMRPNDSWISFMANRQGYHDAIFPFLYPPIWAWLAAQVPTIPFETIEKYATAVNSGLLSACVFLAYRCTRSSVGLPLFSIIALLLLYLTTVGALALFENQPQIFVSFLLLLMLERLRSGSPVLAGVALALAAAIKIYPAIFAVFLLASRQYRATASFMIVGGFLGLISVAIVGWPLHAEFLQTASNVSRTALIILVNYNIHGLAGQLFFQDDITRVLSTQAAIDGEILYWHVLAKGTAWNVAGILAIVFVVALFARGFRHADASRQINALWPGVFLLVPLIMPVSWSYYFIPAVAMVPVLLRNYSPVMFALISGSFFLLGGIPSQFVFRLFDQIPSMGQFIGCLAIVIIALAFLYQPKIDQDG